MTKKTRIFSLLLSALLFASSLVFTVPARAETPPASGMTNSVETYLTKYYPLKEQKLADMVLYKTEKGFNLYICRETGEVALQDVVTGQTLFSNPYDINSLYNNSSTSVKYRLLSQVILTYTINGASKTMYSFEEAALRGQIVFKNIKNGVRVEYAMGEPQVNYLVPRLIEKDRYETLITSVMLENAISRRNYGVFTSFYELQDPNDTSKTRSQIASMQAIYPITTTPYESKTYSGYMAVYVITEAYARELRNLEDLITTYCPKYTYEELEYDHELTHYEGNDEAPPLFRFALEYTIEDEGLSVRLPVSSLRYDESAYSINTISVLPYFGAGQSGAVTGRIDEKNLEKIAFEGYTFVPDGSGTLINFKDLIGQAYSVSSDVFGSDFAYHKITSQHAETMRLPAFGVVTYYDVNLYWEEYQVDEKGNLAMIPKRQYVKEDRGYLAIITEGESMAKITSEHGGLAHTFNSVYATFSPLPTDTYEVQDAISVSGNSTSWTVTSERKYTGSYRIKYIMLKGSNAAQQYGLSDYYECSYVGMADAFRTYLYNEGVLTRISSTQSSLPLFIENFGSMTTMERVLSFPVQVNTPLTTFEDIQTIYNELSGVRYCETCGEYCFNEADIQKHAENCTGQLSESGVYGITNLNFRLTGFANGGMKYTYPAKLKWVNELGGSSGYKELVKFAEEKNIGIYPDFDLAYIVEQEAFDGVGLRSDAVKTIDNRYSVKRVYDAATQTFQRTFSVCVSASVFDKFYTKLEKNLSSYYSDGMTKNISLSTLGTDLNSDFDKKDPYNREDAKTFTSQVLERASNDFDSVLTDGGNSYVLPYVDVILNIPTDSSNYIRAGEAIPFMGLVLHGSKVYASEPINMEGDLSNAILKSIENGAVPFFILSYQNTTKLKTDKDLSRYYSVSYEIWKKQLVEIYRTLDEAIGDLQDQFITGHRFIEGHRVASEEELEMYGQDDVRFKTTSGTVVLVTYENGTKFILNYNSYQIRVELDGIAYTLDELSFVRI